MYVGLSREALPLPPNPKTPLWGLMEFTTTICRLCKGCVSCFVWGLCFGGRWKGESHLPLKKLHVCVWVCLYVLVLSREYGNEPRGPLKGNHPPIAQQVKKASLLCGLLSCPQAQSGHPQQKTHPFICVKMSDSPQAVILLLVSNKNKSEKRVHPK